VCFICGCVKPLSVSQKKRKRSLYSYQKSPTFYQSNVCDKINLEHTFEMYAVPHVLLALNSALQ